MSKRPADDTTPTEKKRRLAIRSDVFTLDAPHPNYNSDVTKLLKQMGEIEKSLGDKNRSAAYMTAVASISAFPRKLTSGNEARRECDGVGEKIAKKVDEIIQTGKLKKLEEYLSDPKISAIHLLCSVTGVGPAAAKKWVNEGITTLELLKKQNLNHHQRLGIEHYEDFKKRIPRKEMDEIFALVKKVMLQIDPKLVVTCCGSYRRQLPDSGDIDILIMHPQFTEAEKQRNNFFGILSRAVKKLTDTGLLIGDLATGEHQYMGICRLKNGAAHRLDFKLFPVESYYCALLHFTGSAEHNRQLSMIAVNKGFKLSEFSLVPIGITGKEGTPLEISSEEDIYEILGIPYRKPEERCL